MKRVAVTVMPYATMYAEVDIPDNVTDYTAYVEKHLSEIEFSKPEIDLTGADMYVEPIDPIFIVSDIEWERPDDSLPKDLVISGAVLRWHNDPDDIVDDVLKGRIADYLSERYGVWARVFCVKTR